MEQPNELALDRGRIDGTSRHSQAFDRREEQGLGFAEPAGVVVNLRDRGIAEAAAGRISDDAGESSNGIGERLGLREIYLDESVDLALQSGKVVRPERGTPVEDERAEVIGANDLPGQPARCSRVDHGGS